MKVEELEARYGTETATEVKEGEVEYEDEDSSDTADDLWDALELLRDVKAFMEHLANVELCTTFQWQDRKEMEQFITIVTDMLDEHGVEDTENDKNDDVPLPSRDELTAAFSEPNGCKHYANTSCILAKPYTTTWCSACKKNFKEWDMSWDETEKTLLNMGATQ